MKKNRIFNVIALTTSLFLLNTSCEVGLGASVDVDAPTLSITYPEQGSVIRENFILYGECADDKGLDHVNVKIQQVKGETLTEVKSIIAEIDELTGTWRAEVNEWLGEGKGYNGWELADGNYVADVNAIDTSGRDSGIASLSFDIDNTAPIFIIKSPTSKKIESPTAYGTSFKVTGTMTDDHTVSKMKIGIYDNKGDFNDSNNLPVLLDEIYETNVDTTTEIIIANRLREGILAERYEKFYADVEEGHDRAMWCTVEVEDNARIYRNPGESDNSSRGNITNSFYIIDDVNSVWFSSDKDMDPGKVRKIVNGTSDDLGISESLKQEVLALYKEKPVTQSAFSINSDANPTYEIRNFGNSIGGKITRTAAAEASVSFSLSPGRNGDNVSPSSVKVFLWGPFDQEPAKADLQKMYSDELSEIEEFAKTPEMQGKVEVISYMGEGEYELNGKKYTYHNENGIEDKNGAGGSVPNFDSEINLPAVISTGKIYYISAHAKDLADSTANSAYSVYAFRGHSSGQPPAVYWENHEHAAFGTNSVADDGIWGNKSKINYTGYTLFADGVEDFDEMQYKTEETEWKTISDIYIDNNNKKVFWRFEYDATEVPEDVIKAHTFTVKAKSLSQNETPLQRRLTIDTKKPELKFTAITPVAENKAAETDKNNYLNGTVNLEAKIEDKNLSKVYYKVYSGTDLKNPVYTSEEFGEDTYLLSSSFDTTAQEFIDKKSDGKDITIILYAEDKAGNKDSVTSTVYNGNKVYKLLQATDKPFVQTETKFGPANTAKKNLEKDAWYTKKTKLNFTVGDDDGLKTVVISKNGTPRNSNELVNVGATNAPINYTLPEESGVYQIQLEAFDTTYNVGGITENRKVLWGPYTIGVDSGAPVIKYKATNNYAQKTNYATDAFALEGTISDDNGIKTLLVEVFKDGENEPVKNYTAVISNDEWSVTIPKGDPDLKDGKYTIKTTATDFAGNSSDIESSWIIDVADPVISSAEIVTSKVENTSYYNTDKLELKVKVSDVTSGISDVQYTTDGTNWTSLNAATDNSGNWTGFVNCKQGNNEIKIQAKDNAGLSSDLKTLNAFVDTIEPSTVSLVSVDGVSNFTGIKTANKDGEVKFVVEVKDEGMDVSPATGTGIKSVVLTKGTNGTLTGVSKGSDKYEVTIPGTSLLDGQNQIFVTVTDAAGNKTSEISLFTIEADVLEPVVEIKSISPVAKLKNDNKNYLNGTITISATVKESNLDEKWYEIYSNGEKKFTSTPVKGTEQGFEFTIDTLKNSIEDNNEFYVIVYAKDKAGNIGKKESDTYTVSQATDKPQIEGSNFTNVTGSRTSTAGDVKNWFTAGDKLYANVTDDDSIKEITVTTKNLNGVAVGSAETYSIANNKISANTLNYSITDYSLPSTEGLYLVDIKAKDTTYGDDGVTANRDATLANALIGVDNAAPVITEIHSAGNTIVRSAPALSGTITEKFLKDIEVKVVNTKTNAVATYTKSAGEVTVSGSTWSCTTAVGEGNYKITVTATDYSGKTGSVESVFIYDKNKPTLGAVNITESAAKYNGEDWFTASETINLTTTATDTISDIVNVQYSLDGTNWSDFTKSGTNWTASVKCAQGENSISVKAIDGSGLESAITTKTVKIDTTAPETLELVSVEGVTGVTSKIVNKNALTFIVKAKDNGVEIKDAKITNIGSTPKNIVGSKDAGTDNYTFSIPKEDFEDGYVYVTATDNAGKSTDATSLFTLIKDTEAPTITISSVTPTISAETTTKVNGTITVTAKIEEDNPKTVKYTVNGVESSDQGAVNALQFTVDTTKYTDKSTLKIGIIAEDEAGNDAKVEQTFTIDQSTDKPILTPSNFTIIKKTSPSAADIPEDNWFNATGNNKITATVTDDDGLAHVEIVTKDAANSTDKIAKKDLVIGTPNSLGINYELPSADGVYQVTINVEDSTYNETTTNDYKANRKAEYGPFIVGVDTADPVITEQSSSGTNYVKQAIELSGTITEANLKDIEVKVVNTETNKVTTYKKSLDEVTVSGTTWSCTTDVPDGSYKITVTATDYAGKSASVERTFVQDKVAPTIDTITIPGATKIGDKNWYKTTTVTLTTTITDATSDVTTAEYSTDGTNWNLLQQGATKNQWSGNITFAKQGSNTVYVRAKDIAGNQTGNTANPTVVYIDSISPEDFTLVSIDGSTEFTSKKLANGSKDITFVVNVNDPGASADPVTGTGIASVKIISIARETKDISFSSKTGNNYTLTVPKENIKDGEVKVQVTDKAGNNITGTAFTIKKDISAPTVSVNPITDADASSAAAIDVNGTITFSGTASDTDSLEDVMLFYKSSASTVSAPPTKQGEASTWTTAGWTKLTNTASKYSWSATLDTTTITDKHNLYFYAVAVDTAGNVEVSDITQLYVNQDSDRPKLIVTNLTLTKDADDIIWHTAGTLTGRVEDDDGTVKEVKVSKDGTTYGSNIYKKGAWSVNLEEGVSTLYFKVKDATDKEFVSAASTGGKPKIYDNSGKVNPNSDPTLLKITVDVTAPNIQSVKYLASRTETFDSTKASNISGIRAVGGKERKYLFIEVIAEDVNGINEDVTLTLGDKPATEVSGTYSEDGKTYTYVGKFDLSAFRPAANVAIENKDLRISVKDKASKSKDSDYRISIDNVGPEMTIDTASGAILHGSVPNTITGTTNDASNVSKLWYGISKNSNGSDVTWTRVAHTTADGAISPDNEVPLYSWSIYFDNNSSTLKQFHTRSLCSLYKDKYTDEAADFDNKAQVPMYLFMKVEDELGNSYTNGGVLLNVVPNADRPTVDITYPAANSAVGGNIRVTGTADIAEDSVAAVYIQIDPDYNAENGFNEDWAAAESTMRTLLKDHSVTNYSIVDRGATVDSKFRYGIPAKGTLGWALPININREFEDNIGTEADPSYRTIAIRAFAVSKLNERVSEPVVHVVPIDPNSPVFGYLPVDGYEGMYVTNTGNASATIRQKWQDEMSLKGEWYLVGSISDDSGIYNAKITDPNGTETELIKEGVITKADWVTKIPDVGSPATGMNAKISIPVGSTQTDGFGTLSYTIWIQDGSDGHSETTKVFKLNYDNKAPEFAVTTDLENVAMDNRKEIYNSNGTFTMGGTFKEDSNANGNQSGFERIVMYITNTRNSVTNLVDPMRSKGNDFISNREVVTGLTNADGLYWRTAKTSDDGIQNGAMTITGLDTSKVRAGGLCKVDGVIYRIKYASGTTVQLDDTEVNTPASAKTVYFAAGALVIDNPNVESGGLTAVYDDSKTTTTGKDTVQSTAGDGDQMQEKAVTSGTQTDWSVSIDSNQIRDGKVDVHFVAFDAAGNSTTYDITNVQVMNNAPRFAGVKFGSDINYDGNITGNEWNNSYANRYVQITNSQDVNGTKENGKDDNGIIQTNIEVDDKYRLPIKTKFQVIPQIVGGNDGLTWKMTYKDNQSTPVENTTTAVEFKNNNVAVGNSDDGSVRNFGTLSADKSEYDNAITDSFWTANDADYTITYTALDLLKLNSNKGIQEGNQDLLFTIEDKTEGGALAATITLPVKVSINEENKPECAWNPLYWNSNTDNSLYNNSQLYGHIDLSRDWKESYKYPYITDDTDDKVSGIITMVGVVKDDVRVDSITVKVDGDTTGKILTRSDSNWTTTDGHLLTQDATHKYTNYFTQENDDWYFELVSDEYVTEPLDAEGNANPDYGKNVVTFKFHWNTDKMLASSKHAKADVSVTVEASDKAPTKLADGNATTTTGTANASDTDTKQLDVVPYIVKVYTELAALQKTEAKWSNTSRTSNGAYPVRVTKKDVNGGETQTSETAYFYGFNLTGATYTDGQTSGAVTTHLVSEEPANVTVSGKYDVVRLDVSKIMALETTDSYYSGEVALTVDGVATINNVNNNDAKGSYREDLTDSNCGTYGYNRQPNSESNYKLTDDVKFDVWYINSQAGKASQGRVEQPVMSINPVTGWIGFAFGEGSAYFTMGGSNNADNSRSWSYYQWLQSYDAFTSIAFAYDSLGHSYGTAAGGDISGGGCDNYVICSSRTGSAALAENNTYSATACQRLEKIGQTSSANTNKQRIMSPSITSAVHGETTNLYLAYFDSINNEIRLRYGDISRAGKINRKDFTEDTDVGSGNWAGYSRKYKTIIANPDTEAGEYLSIAVVSAEGDTVDDNLACVYYNKLTKTLWFTYNTDPTATSNNGTTNRGTWVTPVRVFAANSQMASAGQYCKMVADKNGGLHIAAYDPENQDLCYAYLSSLTESITTSSFRTAVVDSKDVVGSNLSIDVGLKQIGSGETASYVAVPSIGYYSTENVKPMYAYLYDTSKLTSGDLDGAKSEKYTGVWECSLVPTTEVPDLQSKLFNMINVGLWKTAYNDSTKAGVIKTTGINTSVTQTNGTTTYNHGLIWGNGTGNAVLGYAVKHGGGSNNIETAQKR